jgi:hypothetical protein
MGVSGQRLVPAALYPPPDKGPPGTHWTGGWLGPRVGLDTEARGKFVTSAGDPTLIARSSELVFTFSVDLLNRVLKFSIRVLNHPV